MSALFARHHKVVSDNRIRITFHFCRTEMAQQHAWAMRRTAEDLPSKQIEVYESEEVVIVERNLV